MDVHGMRTKQPMKCGALVRFSAMCHHNTDNKIALNREINRNFRVTKIQGIK